MKHITGEHEELYIWSMGKCLKVTAIFTDVDECNNHCAKSYDAVIAVSGDFIFCANRGDAGEKVTRLGALQPRGVAGIVD
jgi:hypothetical protein